MTKTAKTDVATPPTPSTPTPASAATKPRANSLEKIVGALEKVKIGPGPKRHSSGDKPKRTTLIYRYTKVFFFDMFLFY